MKQPRFLLFLTAAILLPGMISGCAVKRAEPGIKVAEAAEFSDQAKADYHYLRYLDMKDEDSRQALEDLKTTLSLSPSPGLYMELANFHWQLGDVEQARAAIDEALSKYPDDRKLYLSMANSFLFVDQFSEAAKYLQRYLEKHPEDEKIRMELASVLIEAEKYDQALDALKSAPEDQRTPEMLYYMARAYSGQNMNREAVSALKQALELNPEFLEALVELAYLYEVEKDYVNAEKTYAAILDLGQSGRDVWLRLIRLNLKLNNPDKAVSFYRQAPDGPEFALEVILEFVREGFYDHARQLLKPMTEQDPVPPEIRFYQAVIAYEGYKDAQKALEYLDQIPESFSSYPQALSFKAQLLLELQRNQEALDLAVKAQEKFPEFSDFYLVESLVYEVRGEKGKAKDTLERAAQKFPNDTEILYRLGIAYENLGDRAAAMEVMEQIIAVDPGHADALNFVGYSLAEEERDLERALDLVKSALEQKPGSGYIIDSLAWVYFKMGRVEDAWEQIRQAVSAVKDDSIIWEHYGDIAAARGDAQEARKAYDKSLELGAKNADEIRKKLESL